MDTPTVTQPLDKEVKTADLDWIALKFEFIKGKWNSVKSFAVEKKLPASATTLYDHTKNWMEEKRGIRQIIIKKSTSMVATNDFYESKEARERHIKIAKYLQRKGEIALDVLEPADADQARKLIETGIREERLALGMDKEGKQGNTNMTQINVNLPKNNFDEIVANLDYAGILELVAEVKRARVNKSGENPIIEGETEAGKK